MISRLVAEEKHKYPNGLELCTANSQFQIYTECNSTHILRIKHLYLQSMSDITSQYKAPVKQVHLTNLNYVIVWTTTNQVDILRLKEQKNAIHLTTLNGWLKNDLVSIMANDAIVVISRPNKIEVFEYNEELCQHKYKIDIANAKCLAVTKDNLYLIVENTLKTYHRNRLSQKYQEARSLVKKQSVIRLEAVQLSQSSDLLIEIYDRYLQLTCGQLSQKYELRGEFKYCQLDANLITIITNDTLDYINFFILNPEICKQDKPAVLEYLLFKYDIYERTSVANYYHIVNMLKKEATAYLKRKGFAAVEKVMQVGENTSSVIYASNANDKIDLLKLDHSKIMDKQLKIKPIEQITVLPITPIIQSTAKQQPKPPDVSNNEPATKLEFQQRFFSTVERLIDKKMSPLMTRLTRLQQRLGRLQQQISAPLVLEPMDPNVVQSQLKKLFEDSILPQLDNYFKQLFSELAQIFQQGIAYYNQKLRIQCEIQKKAFQDLVTQTRQCTMNVMHVIRQELSAPSHVERLLRDSEKNRKQTGLQVQEMLEKVKSGPFSYSNEKIQAKKKDNATQKVKGDKKFIRTELPD